MPSLSYCSTVRFRWSCPAAFCSNGADDIGVTEQCFLDSDSDDQQRGADPYGDIIQYQFFPPNHSVARAEYLSPCIPYEDTGVDKVGFFSGFQAVDAILNNPPTYNLRINDTNPVFFYCTAPGSCIGHGMVGVINPNASVSLAKQRALAMQAAYMLQPGESFPAEASSSIASLAKATTFSTATTPTYTEEATTSAAVPKSANSQPSPKGLSAGAIAGIASGGAAVLLLGAVLFFLLGRTKTPKEVIHNNQGGANRLSGPDMLHSNGAQFIPVTPAGYRKSGKGLGDSVVNNILTIWIAGIKGRASHLKSHESA
ncbi:hypothetical protein BJ546DRAFT_1080133 [Cryomyces antarcticus]